jgi:hypothetical protein
VDWDLHGQVRVRHGGVQRRRRPKLGPGSTATEAHDCEGEAGTGAWVVMTTGLDIDLIG